MTAPFDLSIARYGAFPNESRPSVLWIGDADTNCAFTALSERLNEALAARHFPAGDKETQPHVTLARLRSYGAEAAGARALTKAPGFEPVTMRVQEIAIIESVNKPTGSLYMKRESFTLTG